VAPTHPSEKAHTDIAERKANELELARANGQLRGLLDAATQVSIIATDLNGLILTFNAGAERMLGYTAEQVVGKCTPEILHLPHELEERAAALSKTLGTRCAASRPLSWGVRARASTVKASGPMCAAMAARSAST
jgi:PAS domain-containing protein